MSFVSRLWNAIRNPVRYVGRDFEGNRYFESKSPNDPSRMKRTIRYSEEDDMWKYIGGSKRLPVQWSAWLTHTRLQPPTLEELEGDLARRHRVLANAAIIEARDRAEAEDKLRLRQQDTHFAIEEAASRSQNIQKAPPLEMQTPSQQEGSAVEAFTQVQPPAFLTPSSPRKPKAQKPFALPPLESGVTSQSVEPRSRREDGSEQSNSPSPWKASTTETEAWAPKARKRG